MVKVVEPRLWKAVALKVERLPEEVTVTSVAAVNPIDISIFSSLP